MKKIARNVAVLGILIVIILLMMMASGWIFAPTGEAKYLLILGAMVEGEEPSPLLARRIETAREYLEAHPYTVAVLCGGIGEGDIISEAEVMRKVLCRAGIDKERLLLEDTSVNTWTNLKNALSMIEKKDGERPEEIMVVTSNYHAFRVGFLAKRLGIQVYPVIAPTPISAVPRDFTREILAIVKSFLLDRE